MALRHIRILQFVVAGVTNRRTYEDCFHGRGASDVGHG